MRHYSKYHGQSPGYQSRALLLPTLTLMITIAGNLLIQLEARAQSAWVRKKAETFTQLSISSYQSDRYYNLDGEMVTTTDFAQHNLYFYSEYGLTEKLTIIANLPLLRAHGFTSTETIWGVGDLRVDAKYGFLQEILPISISVGVEAPIAKPNRFAENQDGLGSINLPTGDGEWNFWSTLAISGSLHPLPAYINLSGSYNKRTSFEGQHFKDQWVANAQFGYQFFQKLWLQLSVGVQNTIGEPEGLVSFVRGDGTAFTQYGANLSYQLTNEWGIGLQYYNNADFLVKRVNVYESPTFGISVFFQGQVKKSE
ncbi:hypothetical protein WJR50_18295 [Catalinimonas sp. 4WD22]|uniref:hypothetical protein n=1 Tax=Catalinimonas locisalis TaxID=3133978 RepID=UPI003101324F